MTQARALQEDARRSNSSAAVPARNASLRVRLLLLILLSLVPAAIFLVYDAYTIRQRVEADAQRELFYLAQTSANSYAESIKDARRLLALMAASPALQNAAAGADRANCTAYLAQAAGLSDSTIGFGLWDLDGNLLCAQQVSTTPVNAADRLWFRQVLRTRAFSVGEFQLARPANVAALAFGYPVFDSDGRLQAVLSTGWDLAALSNSAANTAFPPDSIVSVFDHEGVLLARNKDFETWLGKRLSDAKFQLMQAQERGVVQMQGVDGIERLYAFSPIQGPGGGQVWLTVGRTPEVIYAPVSQAIARDLIQIGIILLAAMAAIWIGTDRLILSRIQKILGTSRQFAAGDLSARIAAPPPGDELDALARNLDEMADALQRRQAERDRVQTALRESEKKYSLLFEKAAFGAALSQLPEGILVDVNEAFVNLFGYTKQEVVGKTSLELGINPDAEMRTALRTELEEQGFVRDREITFYTKAGMARTMLNNMTVIELDGQKYILSTVQDITERRHAEQALRASEQRMRMAMQAAALMWWEVNIATGESTVSPNHADILGFSDALRAEDALTAIEKFLSPDQTARLVAALDNTVRGQGDLRLEYRAQHPETKQSLWFEVYATLFREGNQNGGRIIGIAQDITERKRAEQAVRASEQRLRALLENLPGGAAFVVDRDLRYVLAKGEALAAAGVKPDDLVGRTIFQALPPALAASYEPLYRNGLAGVRFAHEHHAHGREYISRGVPLYAADGSVDAVLAVSYDVTERKQAEERTSRLARVTASLAHATSSQEIVDIIIEQGVPAFGAQAGSVAMLDDKHETFRIIAATGYTAELLAKWQSFSLETPVPIADATRAGHALYLQSNREFASRYPALTGDQHPKFEARAVLPLTVGGRLTACIGLSYAEPQRFDEDARRFMETLAQHCGQALERTRLYEAELRARAELETRVLERTQELAEANQARKELLHQLVTTQEEERRRIARELHDQLRQLLTVLDLELEALRVDGRTDAGLQPRIERLQQLGKLTSETMQRLVYDLRPSALDYLGLESTLRHDLGEWSKRHHINAHFESNGVTGRLDPLVEITLYRIVQEALTNVLRHADAQFVSVVLEQMNGHITLIVEDDGRGFELEHVMNGTRQRLGLVNMRERAGMLDGTFEIESAPDGGGTTLFVRIPLERAVIHA